MNKLYMKGECLKLDIGPMMKFNPLQEMNNGNGNGQKGGFLDVGSSIVGLGSTLKDLVVPTALVYVQNKTKSEDIDRVVKDVKVISEELYDKLFSITEYTVGAVKSVVNKVDDVVKTSRTTKKNRKIKNKTRKNKRN